MLLYGVILASCCVSMIIKEVFNIQRIFECYFSVLLKVLMHSTSLIKTLIIPETRSFPDTVLQPESLRVWVIYGHNLNLQQAPRPTPPSPQSSRLRKVVLKPRLWFVIGR